MTSSETRTTFSQSKRSPARRTSGSGRLRGYLVRSHVRRTSDLENGRSRGIGSKGRRWTIAYSSARPQTTGDSLMLLPQTRVKSMILESTSEGSLSRLTSSVQ